MEYKRSTFQLGLQARNVNKSEKNHYNGSFISKQFECQRRRENKEEKIRDKKKEIREEKSREEKKK